MIVAVTIRTGDITGRTALPAPRPLPRIFRAGRQLIPTAEEKLGFNLKSFLIDKTKIKKNEQNV